MTLNSHFLFSVLIAVIVFASKNKVLRESDALGYLIFAQHNIIMSSTFLTIGIIGLMLAVMPVLLLTYGVYAMSCGVAVASSILIPFAVWQYGGYMKRHAGFYFMRKGQNASKNGMKAGKSVDGKVHDTHEMSPSEDDRNLHDPFDPTVAWYSYLKLRKIGMAFASRDADLTGAVDMNEFASVLEADEERIEQLLHHQTDLESGGGSGSIKHSGGYSTVIDYAS